MVEHRKTEMISHGLWEQTHFKFTIEAIRHGWRGVWDHAIAVMRNRDIITVPREVTLLAFVKCEKNHREIDDVCLTISPN